MTAKSDFFALISSKFTEEQVSEIRVETDKLEAEISGSDDGQNFQMTSLYYNCCALFYNCGKNFDNLKLNLRTMSLPLGYTRRLITEESDIERQRIKHYQQIHELCHAFITDPAKCNWSHDRSAEELTSLVYAMTNAIVPEIIAQASVNERLNYFQDCMKIKEFFSQVSAGEKITRIAFDLNFSQSVCVIKNEICINNLLLNMNANIPYTMCLPDNINDVLLQLGCQVKNSVKRIAYRICMVLVRFGILDKVTTSNKYILKNGNDCFVLLNQKVMCEVSDMLEALGQQLKERAGEYGSDINTKYKAEKIKNLLRSGSYGEKTILDDFDYSEITDYPMGCFCLNRFPDHS